MVEQFKQHSPEDVPIVQSRQGRLSACPNAQGAVHVEHVRPRQPNRVAQGLPGCVHEPGDPSRCGHTPHHSNESLSLYYYRRSQQRWPVNPLGEFKLRPGTGSAACAGEDHPAFRRNGGSEHTPISRPCTVLVFVGPALLSEDIRDAWCRQRRLQSKLCGHRPAWQRWQQNDDLCVAILIQ